MSLLANGYEAIIYTIALFEVGRSHITILFLQSFEEILQKISIAYVLKIGILKIECNPSLPMNS